MPLKCGKVRRSLRRLRKGQGDEPRRLVTDKLRSYGAARRDTMPAVRHDTAGRGPASLPAASHIPSARRGTGHGARSRLAEGTYAGCEAM